ncbi:uncharacterized protein ISCGN_013292 [Ixodes scapularis]
MFLLCIAIVLVVQQGTEALTQFEDILPDLGSDNHTTATRLSMVVQQPHYFYCVLRPFNIVINPVFCMRQYRAYMARQGVRQPGQTGNHPIYDPGYFPGQIPGYTPGSEPGYDPGLIDPRLGRLPSYRPKVPTALPPIMPRR